jgi:putative DNA primase/helicase
MSQWLSGQSLFEPFSGVRKAPGAFHKGADMDNFSEAVALYATEDNAALHFANLYKNHLRYCHSTGAWFVWETNIWRQDRTGIALQLAREVARSMPVRESDRIRYTTSKTSFARGVEHFARNDPVFAVTIDVWNSNPWLLGTPDGTVDLCTGELRSAQRRDFITKTTAVTPAGTAECPNWLRFLHEATGGDVELIRFLQQWGRLLPHGDDS